MPEVSNINTPPSPGSRRLETLRHMGIDAWFLRGLPGQLRSPAADVRSEPSVEGQVVGHPGRAVAEALERESVRSVPTTPVVPVPGPAVQSSPAPAPAPVSQPQIALLCFRGAGVILLSSAPVARPHQRLARDIVQAAQRIRQQPDIAVDTVDYSYPMILVKPAMPNPSGLPDAARERTGSPERALRAFVIAQLSRPVEGKQATIGIPGLVLLTHDLQSWFDSWLEEPHLYIDGLALLAGDGARKRHLWQQLRALR